MNLTLQVYSEKKSMWNHIVKWKKPSRIGRYSRQLLLSFFTKRHFVESDSGPRLDIPLCRLSPRGHVMPCGQWDINGRQLGDLGEHFALIQAYFPLILPTSWFLKCRYESASANSRDNPRGRESHTLSVRERKEGHGQTSALPWQRWCSRAHGARPCLPTSRLLAHEKWKLLPG